MLTNVRFNQKLVQLQIQLSATNKLRVSPIPVQQSNLKHHNAILESSSHKHHDRKPREFKHDFIQSNVQQQLPLDFISRVNPQPKRNLNRTSKHRKRMHENAILQTGQLRFGWDRAIEMLQYKRFVRYCNSKFGLRNGYYRATQQFTSIRLQKLRQHGWYRFNLLARVFA